MTAPALAADRFAAACLIGMVLGLAYGFLRPLRPRLTALADFLFLLAAAAGWVFLSFRICQGDLRLGYNAGLLAGGFFWEYTAGRVLRPVFRAFWRGIKRLLRLLFLPFQKILQIFRKIIKKIFASRKKSGTIGSRQNQRQAQARPAGLSSEQQSDQDSRSVHYRTVYSGAADPAPDDRRRPAGG